jgi:hypothetical protein
MRKTHSHSQISIWSCCTELVNHCQCLRWRMEVSGDAIFPDFFPLKASARPDQTVKLELPTSYHLDCKGTHYSEDLTVWDTEGRPRKCIIELCGKDGMKKPVALLQHGLWPSTPTNPETAMDLRLMRRIFSLCTESREPFEAICRGLQHSGTYFYLTYEDRGKESSYSLSRAAKLRLRTDIFHGKQVVYVPKNL